MSRPTDWSALDLDKDPVPGDPYDVKALAKTLHDFADDVGTALRSIRGLAGDSALLDWVGLSGDAFRQQYGDLPKDLDKLESSYRMAGTALATYWPQLEHAQSQADKALSDAQDAKQQLATANSQLSTANDWVNRANTESQKYQQTPGTHTPPPDPDKVKAAARNATQASQAHTTAQNSVHTAQDKLDAAKQLAGQATQLRDHAATTAAHALDDASDAGIQNKHWWQKAVDWVADHWDDIIAVCKVIVAVLGIVVMIIGGPLAWLVVAAALLVLADTINKYLHGKASLWDVAFAALDCIPMTKGLTTAGGLLKMMKEAPELIRSGETLERTANALRKGANSMRESGRSIKSLFTCGDPIDMATGHMVMSTTDVDLPGVLPLTLERHHRSNYRGGHWYGKSWSSTLDQRLWIDDQGIRFTTTDGMVLHYPTPQDNHPQMPIEGPRWPLTWDGTHGGTITITQPETGHTLHFHPLPGHSEAQLPLAEITDRNHNSITFHYHPDSTPAEITHHGGYHIGIETNGRRITALRLLNHPDQPTLLSYAYDQTGNLTTITNSSGLPLTFTYDDHNRITRWEDRNNTWYHYEYDDQGRCVHTTGTDGILDYTYAYNNETHTTRATNSLGHTTTYQFNDTYQLTTETNPLGHTTTRTWDRFDRLLSLTDPLGHTSHQSYDDAGNLVRILRPDGSALAMEHDELGHLITITGPDGAQWTRTYDGQGRVQTTTDPVGATMSFVYGDHGALIGTTDALGGVTSVEIDRVGLPIAVTDQLGSVTRLSRDAFGRIVRIDHSGGRTTRIGWTIEGKVAWRTTPDGGTELWGYDGEGNVILHRNSGGHETAFESTRFDLPAARIAPDGSRSEFVYDTELRLISVTNPEGVAWRYTYDPAGQLAEEIDFNNRRVAYRHDAAGRLIARTNGAGQTSTYTRDAAGRTVKQRCGESVTEFTYDAYGRLAGAVNDDARLTFARDPLGRIIRETCNGRTVTSRYDLLGHRLERRTPSGMVSTWHWDANGRPVSLHADDHMLEFVYDSVGRESRRVLGPQVSLTQEWDAADRLALQVLSGEASPSEPLQQRVYTYDNAGFVTGVVDSTTGTRHFDLDANGRVTEVTARNWTESYAYDRAGNLALSVVGPTDGGPTPSTAMDEADNEPTTSGTLVHRVGRNTYVYDGQGRVVRRTHKLLSGRTRTWQYFWDGDDRLTEMTTPDRQRWCYRYDALGRRTAKQLLSQSGEIIEETTFAWDAVWLAEEIRSSSNDASAQVRTWDWKPGTHLAVAQTEHTANPELSPEEVDRRFYAIVTDLVGAPAELVDEAGQVAWQGRTTVWGSPIPDPPGNVDCPLRFPGQYRDDESGLHYNHYRYYDPLRAGYQSPDRLGLAPAPNHHAYVVNPFTWIDPLGLSPCTSGADDLIEIFRGTDRYAENMIFDQTGMLMSEAAQRVFMEGGTVEEALRVSEEAHTGAIADWGNEDMLAQAHSAFGTEIQQAFGPRSVMSFSTDVKVAEEFARGGPVYRALVSPQNVTWQSLEGAGESEVLVRNMIKVEKWLG